MQKWGMPTERQVERRTRIYPMFGLLLVALGLFEIAVRGLGA